MLSKILEIIVVDFNEILYYEPSFFPRCHFLEKLQSSI